MTSFIVLFSFAFVLLITAERIVWFYTVGTIEVYYICDTAIVLQVMKIVDFQYRTIVLISGLIPVGQLVNPCGIPIYVKIILGSTAKPKFERISFCQMIFVHC